MTPKSEDSSTATPPFPPVKVSPGTICMCIVGTSNLSSVQHISWEFELHAFAYVLGHPAARETNLNYDETLWDMLWRVIQ